MIGNPFPIKSLGQAPSHLTTCENAMNYSTEHPVSIAQPLRERFIADAGPSAMLDQAANLAIRFTAAPRDYLGSATDAMKTRAALGEKIAAAIRALCVLPPPVAPAPQPMVAATTTADVTPQVVTDVRAARIESALARLLASDPTTAACSEDDLFAATNDASAPPFVREQAAAMLEARAALAAAPVQAQEPIGEVAAQGRFTSNVDWFSGYMPPIGTKLYTAPVQPVAVPDGEVIKAAQALLDEHKSACLTDPMYALIEMAKDGEEATVSAALLADLFRAIDDAPAAQGDAKELTDAQIDQLAIQIYGSTATAQERQLARAAIAASKAVRP